MKEFITNNKDYYIPFYQREYSWQKREIVTLFEDIVGNENDSYYLGNLVVQKKDGHTIIVDGQQRVSTIFLLLVCLKDLVDEKESIHIQYMLSTDFKSENLVDGDALKLIIEGKELLPNQKDTLYYKNYKVLFGLVNKENASVIYNQLEKVLVAYIEIDQNVDEHKLFAKINSTGKQLTAFDLVKNNVFSHIKDNDDIEEYLKKISYISDMLTDAERNQLLRHFIAFKTSDLCTNNTNVIYDKFTELFKNEYEDNPYLCLDELFSYGLYNRDFYYIKNNEKNTPFDDELLLLKNSYNTFAVLLIDIMMTYSDIEGYEIKINNEQIVEIKKALLILEAYKVRREFCQFKEKEITRFIPKCVFEARQLVDFSYEEKLIKLLLVDPNTKEKNNGYRMPLIEEFNINFSQTPIYNNPKFLKNFLVRLETSNTKEQTDFTNFSIEHIMPQHLTETWKNEINYDPIKYNKTLHSIGNLTLTADNSELSNKPYTIKKDYLLNNSRITLNAALQTYDEWNYDTITRRANELLDTCNKLWDIREYKIDEQSKIGDEELVYIKNYNRFKSYNKNKSCFKTLVPINKESIRNLIYNVTVNSIVMEDNEQFVFNISKKGWVSKSIYDGLNINGRSIKGKIKEEEFEEYFNKLDVDNLIDYINNSFS